MFHTHSYVNAQKSVNHNGGEFNHVGAYLFFGLNKGEQITN